MPTAPRPLFRLHPATAALAAALVAGGAALRMNAAAPTAPVVTIAGLNTDETIDRDQCLTIAAGAGAAYECGDLRLVHGIPATRSRDRARAPVLIYNSNHAVPTPIFSVNVRLPGTGTVPDSVTADLYIHINGNPTLSRHARWPGSAWPAGATRRITLSATPPLETAAFPYTVEVTNWYGASAYRTTAADTVVLVNRSQTPYRPGWWVAGVEEIHPAQMLWVGGDGSTRMYRGVASNVWKTDVVDGPDSLTYSPASSRYVRHLRGGTRVEFDVSGRHVATVTRLGDTTRFEYFGSERRLKSISMPAAATVSRPEYSFRYGTDGVLDSIVAPPLPGQARLTTLAFDSGTRELTIQDADGASVVFGYAPGDLRIVRRRDRMGAVTRFAYAAAGRLTETRLLMTSAAATDTADLVTAFLPAELRTLNGSAALDTALVTTRLDGAGTQPGDTVTFRLGRWGAPTRITDPLGNVTQLHRENSAFPALVTKSVGPDGFTSRAEYDALGRIVRSITLNARGDGQNDTTSYTYHPVWKDFVAQVRGPMGETTKTDYDALGNVAWSEVGRGVRTSFRYYPPGSPHAGRPRAEVQHLPGGRTAVDSIAYDGTLGNVQATVSPLGFATTVHNDAVGRTFHVQTPIDGIRYANVLTWYDVMGRDTLVRTEGPAMPAYTPSVGMPERLAPLGAEWTQVFKDYDAEGRLLSVATHSEPDVVGSVLNTFTYDRAGRKLTERVPPRTTRWVYDHAGNVIRSWNGRNHVTSMQYDLMNRLVMRSTPAVSYDAGTCSQHGLPGNCLWTFPAVTVSGDTATFEYDVRGNLTAAYNRAARIKRSYYPGGMLKTDSLRIRQYTPSGGGGPCGTPGNICPQSTGGTQLGEVGTSSIVLDPYPAGEFLKHQYGMAYQYDRSGRVTSVAHPSNLSPSDGTGTTRYGYGAAGELALVVDVRGDSIRFQSDTAGRPFRTEYPGSVVELREWDDDGRMTLRQAWGPNSGWLYSDTMVYDARGKVLQVTQREWSGVTARNRYSGLGTLVLSEWGKPGQVPTIEEYRADPLGHVYQSRTRNPDGPGVPDPVVSVSGYHQGSSALSNRTSLLLRDATQANQFYQNDADTTYSAVDLAGNSVISGSASWKFSSTSTSGGTWTEGPRSATNSYYGADEKLRYLRRQGGGPASSGGQYTDGTQDEYWYDALGRRVLVRSLRENLCQASPSGCESVIERTIWAGDQILYEKRGDGGSTANLDAAFSYGEHHGVVGYTHAGGIDQPLNVIRIYALGMSDVTTLYPHANYRGVYRAGTTRTGALHDCHGQGGCINVLWPAPLRGAYHQGDASGGYWVGSLIPGIQDASGLLYRRNRYYNPATGQFTQSDPIGLAGGLNTYGFANGDPTSFADPYGLRSSCDPPRPGCPLLPSTHRVADLNRMTQRPWLDRQLDSFKRNFTESPAADLIGSTVDFFQNYGDMRSANTIGADHYFHCRANCEAAQRGSMGEAAATVLSNAREGFDFAKETVADTFTVEEAQRHSSQDQGANRRGRAGGRENPNGNCRQACNTDRPNQLPRRY